MNAFEPTHEFRGLELELKFANGDGTAWYRDEDDLRYRLPESVVTRSQPLPQPGELWYYGDPSRIRFVTAAGDFVYTDGEPALFRRHMKGVGFGHYKKLLNSDGSPA